MDRSSRVRHENSLGLLTKKFVKLIKQSPDQTIDLNQAHNVLKVQKRRIYDITNVLEGTGFVAKVQKNHVKWIPSDIQADRKIEEEQELLENEIKRLTSQQQELDQQIQNLTTKIEQQFRGQICIQSDIFVTFEDIIKMKQEMVKESTHQNPIIFFIQANEGSQLQIQETLNNRKEIKITSSGTLKTVHIPTHQIESIKK